MKLGLRAMLGVVFCLGAAAVLPSPSHAASGDLDPGFGNGGFVPSSCCRALGIQGDDRLVVAGASERRADGSARLTIVRYEPDGQPDATFGVGGTASIELSIAMVVRAVLPTPEGDVLVGGGRNDQVASGTILVRVDATGAIVSSFGTAGLLADGGLRGPRDFALGPGGTIIVSSADGETVGRWLASGARDATFDTDGLVDLGGGNNFNGQIAVLPDGRIVHARTLQLRADEFGIRVVRLLPTGARDTSFGTDGVVSDLIHDSGPSDLVLQPSGRLIMGQDTSLASPEAPSTVFVSAFTPDGVLDTTFGDGGYTQRDVGPLSDHTQKIALGPDASIFAVATTIVDYNLSHNEILDLDVGLVRFTRDGVPDAAFGDAGLVKLPPLGGTEPEPVALMEQAYLVVQSDGKPVVATAGGLARFLVDDVAPDDAVPLRLAGLAREIERLVADVATSRKLLRPLDRASSLGSDQRALRKMRKALASFLARVDAAERRGRLSADVAVWLRALGAVTASDIDALVVG
jgi:uncharacterized delta-60 repeat protein